MILPLVILAFLFSHRGAERITMPQSTAVLVYRSTRDSWNQSHDIISGFDTSLHTIDVRRMCVRSGVKCSFGGWTQNCARNLGAGVLTYCWLKNPYGGYTTVLLADMTGDGKDNGPKDFTVSFDGKISFTATNIRV